jgi:hypothetical protein
VSQYSKYRTTIAEKGARTESANPDPTPVFYDNRVAKNGYGVNGFVNLTFAGPNLSAEYEDLDGTKVLREQWTVDGGGAVKLQARQQIINDPDFQ